MVQNSELMRGIAETVILKLLSERTMYGYEIIKLVNERTNGEFQWKEGTLYPCLHRLEEAGLIASSWELSSGKPRKYYSLTKKGKIAVPEKVGETKRFCTALGALLANA
ncbi:MAG: lineage-specific thermal regulator protein [Lentisphaerae bacterium ADurb.Bin242]|nr:MAG: lineage-specific thermal regulator protein [Lentisphaerae bacterium ADurb.Bin242]